MTLEQALKAAEDALCDKFCPAGEGGLCACKSAHLVETVVQSIERAGFVLCNRTLTMDQRNKMSDAFHNNFQSMQAVHDVMIKGVK